jgi:hypothetical protein
MIPGLGCVGKYISIHILGGEKVASLDVIKHSSPTCCAFIFSRRLVRLQEESKVMTDQFAMRWIGGREHRLKPVQCMLWKPILELVSSGQQDIGQILLHVAKICRNRSRGNMNKCQHASGGLRIYPHIACTNKDHVPTEICVVSLFSRAEATQEMRAPHIELEY